MEVEGAAVSALGKHWHPACFVCHECRCAFPDGSFYAHQGWPYCDADYTRLVLDAEGAAEVDGGSPA